MTFTDQFFNNLFGTIAKSGVSRYDTSIGFIPANNKGDVIKLQSQSASWLGMKNPLMQLYAYEFCFPVSTVVDRLAEYDLSGEMKIIRAGGKGAQQLATSMYANSLRKLLDQPNPFQSWEQFRGQQLVYKKTFGYCPAFAMRRAGFGLEEAIQIINLPPWLFKVYVKKNIFRVYEKIEEVVEKYTLSVMGETITLPIEDVMILEDGFMQNEKENFVLPQSRLVGLDFAISNICAAMEADNVLLKKKGPLGFISHDAAATKDSMSGYIPMSKPAKKELQRVLDNYGMSWNQYQYVISRQAVKWNPISFDVKQLDTKATIIANEKAVCHRFAFPYVLYEETEATYANGENAATAVYQTNVIPNAKRDMRKYEKFFKAAENNVNIVNDFSQIDFLQEDDSLRAATSVSETTYLEKEWLNNLITWNEWRVARNYEAVPGMDIYYYQWKEQFGKQQTEPINNTDQNIQ